MTRTKPISELTKGWSKDRLDLVEERVSELKEEMVLAELRKALGITQEELAARMEVGQTAITKLERRKDMHVSKLRELIEAMGGELLISARFPERDVAIQTLGSASSLESAR